MRMSLFLLFAGLMQVFAESYAQDTRLTIYKNNITLENLLTEIESNSEFFFFYSNEKIDKSITVNIDAQQQTIAGILDHALKGTDITYQVIDKAIILSKKNVIQPIIQQPVITGTVTDISGEPLPGVNIIVKGTLTGAVTNVNGKYTITVPDKDAVLVFTFMGYETREFTVGEQTVIDLVLSENAREIEEIVVVGYGVQNKKTMTGSVSVIDMKEVETNSKSTVS